MSAEKAVSFIWCLSSVSVARGHFKSTSDAGHEWRVCEIHVHQPASRLPPDPRLSGSDRAHALTTRSKRKSNIKCTEQARRGVRLLFIEHSTNARPIMFFL
uniref:Putative secreted protein n=1 Tax=Ixodes ricinus TaxID=34613 RepID=A0A147BMX3_IXORI